MNRLALLLITLLPSCLPLQAQFLGGSGDGYGHAILTQSDLEGIPVGTRPLYAGGRGDGFHRLQRGSLSPSGTDLAILYRGGAADGFDGAAAAATLSGQDLAVLYTGGPGDGFTLQAAALGLEGTSLGAVYGGGSGDGYADLATFAGLDGTEMQVLFTGGAGDGFDFRTVNSSLAGLMPMLYVGGNGDGHSRGANMATISGVVLTQMYGGGSGEGSFGSFFAGTVPLPLTLIRFDAFPMEDYVLVKWVTEDEVDTEFFTVEKTKRGYSFVDVGHLAAAGTSAPGQRLSYQLEDHDPYTGTSFYRLRTTDFDGRISLSHLVEVQFTGDTDWDFALFPNPNTGKHLSVVPTGDSGGQTLQLEIVDVQGRLLERHPVQARQEAQRVDLLSSLPPGSYLIRLRNQAGEVRAKILLVGR